MEDDLQNRYMGDIGDFAKYGLLRALGEGCRLGIAWYLFPDEAHNKDGRHTDYLKEANKWRQLDPVLFDGLCEIVRSGSRDVLEIERSELLGNAIYFSKPLSFQGKPGLRAQQRREWFNEMLRSLESASIVFADPDNGLCSSHQYTESRVLDWKRMPLYEAQAFTAERPGIIYHHNTRTRGGHIQEIQYWLNQLGPDTMGLYWRRISNRTFFIVHPTDEMRARAHDFARRWAPHFELITIDTHRHPGSEVPRRSVTVPYQAGNNPKTCPECGHTFTGKGWGGIDAHWKSQHEHIMPYADAWPLIRAGKRPSAS
jgi:hypothetical protein